MLGDVLGESTGKRIVRRVLATNPPKVEVSFEESGQMLGIPCSGFGTYTSEIRQDGTLYGEGQGAFVTNEGEMVTWQGSGMGIFQLGGAISYRGMLFYRTASQNLAKLNTVCGAFEYDVDAEGKTKTKIWAWS